MCLAGGTVGSNRAAEKPKPIEQPKNQAEQFGLAGRTRLAELDMVTQEQLGKATRRVLTSVEASQLQALKYEYEQALKGEFSSETFKFKNAFPNPRPQINIGLPTAAEKDITAEAVSQTPIYEDQFQSAQYYQTEIERMYKQQTAATGLSPNLYSMAKVYYNPKMGIKNPASISTSINPSIK